MTNRTPTSRPGSLFDRLTPVTSMKDKGVKLSLYGRAKTGKTRLMCSFPKPFLVIGAEDGTRSVRSIKGVDFLDLRHSEEVQMVAEGIASGRLTSRSMPGQPFAGVGVDTASALANVKLAEILNIPKLPEQGSWGMATREQYGEQSLALRTMLRYLLDLPIHVVITAHERNFQDESTPSDLIMPTVGSALSASVTGWLNGAVEYIGQCFIREQTISTQLDENDPNTVMEEKTGKMEYCLRVGPHPVYQTGFRLPPGYSLPDVVVNPSFDKIQRIINGEK